MKKFKGNFRLIVHAAITWKNPRPNPMDWSLTYTNTELEAPFKAKHDFNLNLEPLDSSSL